MSYYKITTGPYLSYTDFFLVFMWEMWALRKSHSVPFLPYFYAWEMRLKWTQRALRKASSSNGEAACMWKQGACRAGEDALSPPCCGGAPGWALAWGGMRATLKVSPEVTPFGFFIPVTCVLYQSLGSLSQPPGAFWLPGLGPSEAPKAAGQTATHRLPRRGAPCARAPRLLSSRRRFWSVGQSENIAHRSGSLPTCLQNYWSNRPEHTSYYRHLQSILQREKNIIRCIRKMSHDTSLQMANQIYWCLLSICP